MLIVLGATHHDIELGELEKLSAAAAGLGPALIAGVVDGAVVSDGVGSVSAGSGSVSAGSADGVGASTGPIDGTAVLATCNRLEIYVDARRFHDAVDAVTNQVAQRAGMDQADVARMLRVRVGAPVAAHLFSVASGLDSMVVGEAEIAGQVSGALRAAQIAGTASPALNRLFQSASRTSKKVTSTTGLGRAGRSIATVALDIAAASLPASSAGRALIIGTGAYARVVATALRARGCTDLRVYSPSGRAQAFAQTHSARPVLAQDLDSELAEVDLVVACSGTTGGALGADLVRAARAGSATELVIVDLALRPDVSADVRQLPAVRVVDLFTVAERAVPEQTEAITAAQDIVIAAVAEFEDNQAARSLDPAVVALRTHVSSMVDKEMVRLRGKYDTDVAAELEQSLHRVTRSLLHTPTLRAQELARSGDGAGYVAALHTLFGIDLSAPTAVPAPLDATAPSAAETAPTV